MQGKFCSGWPAAFWVLFCVLLLMGLSPWQAGGEEVEGAKATLASQKPEGPAVQALVLEPFYFFREKESGVWVERILVQVEVYGDQVPGELSTGQNRALLQEILDSETDADQLAARALANLQKNLGSQALQSLKVSRSTLILR